MPKRFRHHADHGMRHPIEGDGLANPVRPAAEMLPPKIVTDDDDASGARFGLPLWQNCVRASVAIPYDLEKRPR